MRDRERRRTRIATDGIQCKGGKDEIIQGGRQNVVLYGVSKGIRVETVRSKAKYSGVAGVTAK